MATNPGLNRPTEEQAITLAHRRAAIRANLARLPNNWERVIVLLCAIGFNQVEISSFEFGVTRQRIGNIIRRARRQMEVDNEKWLS